MPTDPKALGMRKGDGLSPNGEMHGAARTHRRIQTVVQAVFGITALLMAPVAWSDEWGQSVNSGHGQVQGTPAAVVKNSSPASEPGLHPRLPTVDSGSAHGAEAQAGVSQAATKAGSEGLVPGSEPRDQAARVVPNQAAAVWMAKSQWIDKAAAGEPALIEGICRYQKAANILAASSHISQVAEADHYTCRRLTQWKSAARILAKNPYNERCLTLDPEGICFAIRRDRRITSLLARNVEFQQLIDDNPQLGRYIAAHM